MSISSEFKEDAFSMSLLLILVFILTLYFPEFWNKSEFVSTCVNRVHIHKRHVFTILAQTRAALVCSLNSFCFMSIHAQSNCQHLFPLPLSFKCQSSKRRYHIHCYYIAINIKWLKLSDKSRGTSVPISLDIGTLTWYRHAYSDAFACCRCLTLL